MTAIEKWPIPEAIKNMSDDEIVKYLFQKADDAGRDNMGVPDLVLARAAHRLAYLSSEQRILLK